MNKLVAALLLSLFSIIPAFASEELDQMLNAPLPPRDVISTRVKIALKTDIDSRTNIEGDKIEAVLKEDILHDDYVLAPAGSRVFGTIKEISERRGIKKTIVSVKPRLGKPASMLLSFDKVITPKNEHYEMVAKPAPQLAIVQTAGKARRIRVNPHGELIKTETLDVWQVPELEIALPASMFDDARQEIRMMSGDIIAIDAKVETTTSAVSAKILGKKKDDTGK